MLEEACRLLLDEVSLPGSAPGGRVEFKRTLVVSFFFKFYLEVLQKLKKLVRLSSAPLSARACMCTLQPQAPSFPTTFANCLGGSLHRCLPPILCRFPAIPPSGFLRLRIPGCLQSTDVYRVPWAVKHYGCPCFGMQLFFFQNHLAKV